MRFSKFIVIPLYIAAMAGSMQAIDQFLMGSVFSFLGTGAKGYGWIAFQAWAMYFLAGCTITGGIRALLGYGSGIVASIIIMLFGGALSASFGFWGFPAAVFCVVVPVMCLERIPPWLDFVPAVFVGAGVFFGFMSYVPGATFVNAAITELFYCVFGLIYGWVTVSIRGAYEASFNK